MRRFITLIAFGFGLAVSTLASAGETSKEVTLYKTPACTCCESYAQYLRENGYAVTVEATHDLAVMNEEAGLPAGFEGCHLAFVDDYVVSGHVPVNVVDRMLEERPDVKGITLPGMPLGSPGMGDVKPAPLTIYEFGDDAPQVYAVE